MSRIDIGITMSMVRVTGALKVRMVSAHYHEKYLSQSLYFSDIE
jgi:hypothetical protein